MNQYKLAIDGDRIEKFYWNKFIQNHFPSYEIFWQKFVVRLTNRPNNIHFKTDKELRTISKTAHDICLAQLHYSVLRHLIRVYQLLNQQNFNLDSLTEGMARINGALDVGFELLERFQNPKKYDPWLEKKEKKKLGGREARETWQKSNLYPLQHLRDYRNHLIHGRLLPGITGHDYFLPKIRIERKYFDWRLITDPQNNPGLNPNDLLPAKEILRQAWIEVLNYLENQWQTVLLK